MSVEMEAWLQHIISYVSEDCVAEHVRQRHNVRFRRQNVPNIETIMFGVVKTGPHMYTIWNVFGSD